jgi:hypothetical protein
MHRITVFLVASAILAALLLAPAGAGAVVPEAGELNIYVPSSEKHPDPHHLLAIHLSPERGIAEVTTSEGEMLGAETFRADNYAMAIPKGSFEGSIDLRLPELGEIVGSITPEDGDPLLPPAKVCHDSSDSQTVTFRGRIEIRDASAHGPWSVKRAEGWLDQECEEPTSGKATPRELFDVLREYGGPSVGASSPSFFFFSSGGRHTRPVEFLAVGTDLPAFDGTFAATANEWLPGEVATRRVVVQRLPSFSQAIEAFPAQGPVSRVTFSPPAPFFGTATYSRSTGKLRGSLGVRFPGLALHLAHPPLGASLEADERR